MDLAESRLRVSVALFALGPPLLAASTFAYGPDASLFFRFIRWFSTPITLIEWIVVGLAMSVGVSPLAELSRLPRAPKVALAIVSLIAIVTATTATADPVSANIRTAAWFCHLLFGLTLYVLVGRTRDLTQLEAIWPRICGGLILFGAGLVLFVASIPDQKLFDWIEFYYGVVNVRQLGFYSGSGFAIAIGIAFSSTDPRKSSLFAFAAALLIGISFWAGIRSALLGTICALGLAFISLPNVRSWRNLMLTAAAVLGGFAIAFLHTPAHKDVSVRSLFERSRSTNFDVASSGRLTMWRDTLEVAKQKPLFGFGESQYRLAVPAAKQLFNHPHNAFIQMIFQWGVVGALCFFFLFGRAWFSVWQASRTWPALGVPAFLVVSCMFGMAMIEGSLYHTWPVAMMAFAAAVSIGGAKALDRR
jgi:O-antigen ligase